MRERKPGVWELRVFVGRDASGKVRHRNATFHGTKRAAERELTRLIAEEEATGTTRQQPVGRAPQWGPLTTVNDAIEGWKRTGWDDLSPSTVRRYEGVWRRHVRDSIGQRRITAPAAQRTRHWVLVGPKPHQPPPAAGPAPRSPWWIRV
jgi:hypothetical protein